MDFQLFAKPSLAQLRSCGFEYRSVTGQVFDHKTDTRVWDTDVSDATPDICILPGSEGERIVRRLSHWAKSSAVGVAVTLGVAAGGAIALGAHFARRVLTPTAPESGVTVEAIEPRPSGSDASSGSRVWLAGTQVDLVGRYSFIWAGGAGHAKLGAVEERRSVRGGLWVAREILSVDRGTLRVGARGRLTGWWYTDPKDAGFEYSRVSIRLPGGLSWGWLVPPAECRESEVAGSGSDASADWAIHVHGRGALPEEVLRGLRPCAQAGLTSLVIAYRNDSDAPVGNHRRYGLGIAESHDVMAAIDWALSHGARSVTLFGYSMGGTAVVRATSLTRDQNRIRGIVLDSPALDWPGVFTQQARLARVPVWVARLGQTLLQCGLVRGAVPGTRVTDISSLRPEALAAHIRVPVLVHASPEDTFVPWQGSRAFVQQRPELFSLCEGAGEHVKLWNTDPESWEAATLDFLRELERPE